MAGSGLSSCSCPVTRATALASLRCVSEMPAWLPAAKAAVMPGTISSGMPAATRASTSSAARANTAGSPALSRTTVRPARASRNESGVDFLLREDPAAAMAPQAHQLGPWAGVLEDLRIDQVVVEHDVGPGQAVATAEGEQSRIARAGADQIDAAQGCFRRLVHRGC